jgi:hypothetical protein
VVKSMSWVQVRGKERVRDRTILKDSSAVGRSGGPGTQGSGISVDVWMWALEDP